MSRARVLLSALCGALRLGLPRRGRVLGYRERLHRRGWDGGGWGAVRVGWRCAARLLSVGPP